MNFMIRMFKGDLKQEKRIKYNFTSFTWKYFMEHCKPSI